MRVARLGFRVIGEALRRPPVARGDARRAGGRGLPRARGPLGRASGASASAAAGGGCSSSTSASRSPSPTDGLARHAQRERPVAAPHADEHVVGDRARSASRAPPASCAPSTPSTASRARRPAPAPRARPRSPRRPRRRRPRPARPSRRASRRRCRSPPVPSTAASSSASRVSVMRHVRPSFAPDDDLHALGARPPDVRRVRLERHASPRAAA